MLHQGATASQTTSLLLEQNHGAGLVKPKMGMGQCVGRKCTVSGFPHRETGQESRDNGRPSATTMSPDTIGHSHFTTGVLSFRSMTHSNTSKRSLGLRQKWRQEKEKEKAGYSGYRNTRQSDWGSWEGDGRNNMPNRGWEKHKEHLLTCTIQAPTSQNPVLPASSTWGLTYMLSRLKSRYCKALSTYMLYCYTCCTPLRPLFKHLAR